MTGDIASIIDWEVMGNAGCGIKKVLFCATFSGVSSKGGTSFQLGRQIRQSHLYYYFQRRYLVIYLSYRHYIIICHKLGFCVKNP